MAAAKKSPYRPAIAMLTAFPLPGSEGEDGADKLLVKPMNTSDLLRQLEALLVTHEDNKRKNESGGSAPTSAKIGRKKRPAVLRCESQPANAVAPGEAGPNAVIKLAEAH